MAWTWADATCRGTSHVRDGSACQDMARCIEVDETLIAVVSDGAGSASLGRQGAAITCRTISELARSHFNATGRLPSDEEIWIWIEQVRDRIEWAATARGVPKRAFSSTLVAVLANSAGAIILHVGDGAAVARIADTWAAVSWPAHGEYAAQTFFMTDEPAPRLRIARLEAPVAALGVFSDGIERLVLDFAGLHVSAGFFEAMTKPIQASERHGRDAGLSASLGKYLASDAINARTDDDKSLILAVRR